MSAQNRLDIRIHAGSIDKNAYTPPLLAVNEDIRTLEEQNRFLLWADEFACSGREIYMQEALKTKYIKLIFLIYNLCVRNEANI